MSSFRVRTSGKALARSRSEPAGIVIVGGGVIGCAIAFELAGRGHQVTVVDRSQPGRAATWAAAGMLSPLGESPPDTTFAALASSSLSTYPNFLAEIGNETAIEVEFNAPGKLEVAFDDAEAARLTQLCGVNGVPYLPPAEARALETGLSREVAGAIHFAADALVDPRALGHALWHACEKRGVSFRIDETVQKLRRIGDSVGGIVSNAGAIDASIVVIAAGAWSGAIEGLPVALPITPVRGQMIALRSAELPFRRLLQSKRCYMIPRSNGRVLVGATVERVGFDARTTAAGLAGLLAAAIELVPSLAEAELAEYWTGFRPGTPDDLPVLGADSKVSGLYYATGHYRNGILLAPITAQLTADLIEQRQTSHPLYEFRAERFGPAR